jgi:hypothetical protein
MMPTNGHCRPSWVVITGTSTKARPPSPTARMPRVRKKKPTARASKMPAWTRRWRSAFMFLSSIDE